MDRIQSGKQVRSTKLPPARGVEITWGHKATWVRPCVRTHKSTSRDARPPDGAGPPSSAAVSSPPPPGSSQTEPAESVYATVHANSFEDGAARWSGLMAGKRDVEGRGKSPMPSAHHVLRIWSSADLCIAPHASSSPRAATKRGEAFIPESTWGAAGDARAGRAGVGLDNRIPRGVDRLICRTGLEHELWQAAA